MAKSLKRIFDSDLSSVISPTLDAYIWTRPPPADGGPAPGPGDVLNPGPLPPLFTKGHDNVNFASVAPNDYDPTTYYDAQRGNDTVVLPADQAKATAIGYNAANMFQGNVGNDFIVGGALNDRINGGSHNDRLFGNTGEDRKSVV